MKRFILQLLLVMYGLHSFGQYDRVDSLLLDLFGNDRSISQLFGRPQTSYYIYSGLFLDNKTFYAGRELGDNMYSMSGALYLMHRGGLYAGASGAWYSQLDPAYNATVVTAGIRKPLNKAKTLTFRLAYSRYIFNVDESVGISFRNNAGAGLTLRNNWIGGRVSFNFLFGNEYGMNISPAIFADLTIARFGKSNRVLLSPEINAFVGSETIEYESTGSVIDPEEAITATSDKYGLLNTRVSMPVSFYSGNFNIEMGYSVNFPTTGDSNTKYPVNSFFSLSIGYLLPLRK